MEEGAVEVWVAFVPDTEDEAEVRRQLALLSQDERERCGRRPAGAPRREFRAAHALVREVLSRQANTSPGQWRFEDAGHGRPAVTPPLDPPLDFNLSHTEGLVACAIGRGVRVGVDVESLRLRRSVDAIARRIMSEDERRDLDSLEGAARRRRFLEYWTLKEALLKATGQGLSDAARSLSFELDGDVTTCRMGDGMNAQPRSWRFHRSWPSERHALAVAVHGAGAGPIRVTEWPAPSPERWP